MKYTEYDKQKQREFLVGQIRDLETQHFQQVTLAECAEAAADLEPPADDVLDAAVGITKEDHEAYVRTYKAQAFQHRRAAAEAERRIVALRTMQSIIEDKALPTRASTEG